MAMGWHLVSTHLGVTITGSTSTRYLSISKLAEPAPMITPARISTTSTPVEASTRPTSCRLSRCSLSTSSFATQSTEVHDATDAGLGCGLCEVRRIAVLTVRPPLALPDGVDQVDGDVHTGHRQRELSADVSLDDLGRALQGAASSLAGVRARQRTSKS